jgi:hypothetical protein
MCPGGSGKLTTDVPNQCDSADRQAVQTLHRSAASASVDSIASASIDSIASASIDQSPRSFSLNRVRLKRINLHTVPQDQPERYRGEMLAILQRKKISQKIANRMVGQTLEIAAGYAQESARRDRYFENRAEATKGLDHLITHLNLMVQAISKLSPSSQSKLCKIISSQCWRQFDTETFAEIVHAMLETNLSPPRIAEQTRSAMTEADASRYLAVRSITRTAPPLIIELWEMIPSETRAHVEQNVRRRLFRSALVFFRYLADDLTKYRPRDRRVRRPPKVRLFASRIAPLWEGLARISHTIIA